MTQKEWEKQLKSRFMNTEIWGILRKDGSIGINKESIVDEFIKVFRERLIEIKEKTKK